MVNHEVYGAVYVANPRSLSSHSCQIVHRNHQEKHFVQGSSQCKW